jgi:uncharacterized membrane protein
MTTVHEYAESNVPVEFAFAYVDDYRNVPDWMYGLKKYEPAGEKDRGLGAVFEGTAKLGATLHTTVEVTEWVENELATIKSVKGFEVQISSRYKSLGPERSGVDVEIYYHFGGGLAGKALEKVCEPVFKIAIIHAKKAIIREVERLYAESKK